MSHFDNEAMRDLMRQVVDRLYTFQEIADDPGMLRLMERWSTVTRHWHEPKLARDASTFVFHPDQPTNTNDDGSLTARFEAGGVDEICWHLVTWGESVTIEKPVRLRWRLAEMCESLAAHHRHGRLP